ncbi:MAG: methyltransferase domain-containing protein [Ardenticatenales bacterium]|nr:methyltransferase domain-containing protein [Ardenticatenales bacterium]
MSESQRQQVAAAFNRKAAVYDEFGVDHPNLDRIRGKVYDHISRWHPAGSHLLELNAGTGLDATRLSARGYRIHATDLAPQMVAAIQAKIEQSGLHDQLTAEQCDFNQLATLRTGPFDGLYSNSGGLNCTADLAPIIAQLPRLLKPGAIVTWVIMPRICPWELALLAKDPRVATRRLRPGGVRAHVEGVHFQTWYHPAGRVIRAFGTRFELVELEGISVVTPTADNKTFAQHRPGLYQQLVRLDDWLSRRRPFNGWGDFYALSMRFRG